MKYQIVLLGTPWIQIDKFKDMICHPMVEFVEIDKVEHCMPILYLYFGFQKEDSTLNESVRAIVKDAVRRRIIQPVACVPDDFNTKIPEELKILNGFFMNDNENGWNRLKNLVLSFFGLMDANRKVFISYRRTELQQLAQNLFVELVKRRYRPFLDSYSIEEGVDFQEYLRHELVDSDILILLDSPDFNTSDYCKEEFNIANKERIPVFDVRFNVDARSNFNIFCDYYETGMDCDKANKDESLVQIIADKMESCCFRAYNIKRQFVLDEFRALHARFNLDVTEEGGFLRSDTTKECFFLLTRIPTANDMYMVDSMFKKLPLFTTYNKIVLYNGSYCRQDIRGCLRWLDSYLPVRLCNVNVF